MFVQIQVFLTGAVQTRRPIQVYLTGIYVNLCLQLFSPGKGVLQDEVTLQKTADFSDQPAIDHCADDSAPFYTYKRLVKAQR